MNMSLEDWYRNGWLKKHTPAAPQIAQLLEVAQRDLRDAEVRGLSDDWRFGIAYNAALQLAHAALLASGYETPKGESHHFRVIESLAMTIGAADSLVRNFNGFRKMRNAGVYERAGVVSRDNAKEMLEMAKELHETVAKWLRAHHPELV